MFRSKPVFFLFSFIFGFLSCCSLFFLLSTDLRYLLGGEKVDVRGRYLDTYMPQKPPQDEQFLMAKNSKKLAKNINPIEPSSNESPCQCDAILAHENEKKEPYLAKKMTLAEFEGRVSTEVNKLYKGVVLSLSGSRLEGIKSSFTKDESYSSWSSDYERNISAFISENDLNSEHFIQYLSCNKALCRLEVATSNKVGWETVFSAMTRESWYSSVTFQEEVEGDNIVYYIKKHYFK